MTRVLFALLLALCTTVAHADVAPGQRVRATLIARPDAPVVGTLLAFHADSLALAAEPDSATRSFARSEIALLEQSTGMHNKAARGAVIGAVVGGLGAALFGVWIANAVGEGDPGAIPLLLGVGGAVGGGLIGAAIGEGSKHEGWERVHP